MAVLKIVPGKVRRRGC